jgi:predicted acetyltransferase
LVLLAIIFRHIARYQIRRYPQEGAGLALAGLVIGYAAENVVLAKSSRRCPWILCGYPRRVPELIAPAVGLHSAWLEARAEWGPGVHEDGFGLGPTDEVHSPAGFAAWVARPAEPDSAKPIEAGEGRCRYRWIVESNHVLGAIALRYGHNDYVRWAGHIGYGICPSARRRGLATWALGRMLDEARVLGLDRVLAVCAVDNVASVKIIERCGGVFEGIQDTTSGPARRYWIEL